MSQLVPFDARPAAWPLVLLRTPDRRPAVSVGNPAEAPHPIPPKRSRIWELSPNLHCSIIGTCLSAAELRRLLSKAGFVTAGVSDHDLHKQAVLIAGRHDGSAKLLHKALDHRHRLPINQFARASTEDELRALWAAARQRGDIPGAYWAILTHPATSDGVIEAAFGDVHMLSHLVGAANRADIRRLSVLEAKKAELETKIRKQQEQLRNIVVSRDAKIRELTDLLAGTLANAHQPAHTGSADAALAGLVAELERRLSAEAQRRQRLEQRREASRRDLAHEHALRVAAERQYHALREELEALEAGIAPATSPGTSDVAAEGAVVAPQLRGTTLLYVGGRPSQIRQIRAVAESCGAVFLEHDGGVEDSASLLAGLVGRADAVLFPVDCVSHAAVSAIKPLCRQRDKPYLPLRSSGLGSFVAAMGRVERAREQARSGTLMPA